MEENKNISISNMNNMILRIIPREYDFDFHDRTGEIWRSSVKCPRLPGASKSYRGNNFFLSNWMSSEEISNFSNLSWMNRIDSHFILLIVVGAMGGGVRKNMGTLVSEKRT
jgi:hypothetical protein